MFLKPSIIINEDWGRKENEEPVFMPLDNSLPVKAGLKVIVSVSLFSVSLVSVMSCLSDFSLYLYLVEKKSLGILRLGKSFASYMMYVIFRYVELDNSVENG